MKTKIVCISGKARSGKDSIAFFIKKGLEDQGKSVLIVHYADLLKYICKKYYNWNGEKDANGRTLLQSVGSHARDMSDGNFWAESLKEIIECALPQYDYILIADVRYPNEIDIWKNDDNYETITLRINRNTKGLDYIQARHSSETALDNYKDFNFYVTNDYSLETLYEFGMGISKDLEIGIYEGIYKRI